MINYKNNYKKTMRYADDEFYACEICNAQAVDIHHIRGRIGNDVHEFKNLIGLCRSCHNKAHDKEYSVEELLQYHHDFFIKRIKQL